MYKYLLCFVIGAGLAAAGTLYLVPKSKPLVVTEVKEVVKEVRIVELQKAKDVVRVVVRTPDGTVTERTEEHSTSVVKEQTKVESRKDSSSAPSAASAAGVTKLPDWRISVARNLAGSKETYSASVGYRVLGPVWVESTYQNKSLAVGLGVTW